MQIRKMLFMVCVTSLGCDAVAAREQADPRLALLQQEIQSQSATQNYLLQQLANRDQVASALEVQVNELEGTLRAHNDEVEAYIWNHKTASLCLAAGGIALSSDNEYSDDIKGLGTIGAVLCTLAFASDANFRREVINVGDQLMQADARAKNLRSQMREAESRLYRERSQAVAVRTRYDSVASSIQNLQLQLDSLSLR